MVGTHGLRGELRVKLFNADSDALATVTEVVLLDDPDATTGVSFAVVASRPHGNVERLTLDGIESIDQAKALVGRTLAVREEDLEPLAEGQYYSADLIGLSVFEEDGTELGSVGEVIVTGANDVLSVVRRGEERLIPVVSDVVLSIDIPARRIVVRMPLELEEE